MAGMFKCLLCISWQKSKIDWLCNCEILIMIASTKKRAQWLTTKNTQPTVKKVLQQFLQLNFGCASKLHIYVSLIILYYAKSRFGMKCVNARTCWKCLIQNNNFWTLLLPIIYIIIRHHHHYSNIKKLHGIDIIRKNNL